MKEPGAYSRVGRTRDDAAGEAYDKVARLLGLGYPGGPIVDKRARDGNDQAIALPLARMTHADRNAPGVKGDLDFSFSGLKTAVLRHVRQRTAPLTDAEIDDICASFQRVVVSALLDRVFDAAERFGAQSVGIAGGVSANARLRNDFAVARGAARVSRLRAGALAVDGQCGDDCRRRPQELPRGQARRARSERGPEPGTLISQRKDAKSPRNSS